MNIEEAQKEKCKLEKEISKVCCEFSRKTRLTITDIEKDVVKEIGNIVPAGYIIEIEIKL